MRTHTRVHTRTSQMEQSHTAHLALVHLRRPLRPPEPPCRLLSPGAVATALPAAACALWTVASGCLHSASYKHVRPRGPLVLPLSHPWERTLQPACPPAPCFSAESQKADLPEGTPEGLPPAGASGMGPAILAQPEALLGQGDGDPGPDHEAPGHLPPSGEAEAKAPGASGQNPGTGLELPAAPSRVSEAPAGQEAAPDTGQGPSPSDPDAQPAKGGMELTSGPPAEATAAPGGEDLRPR